jgi:hypothetical protein
MCAGPGFAGNRNGIVVETRTGETFTDPVGTQAYGFRYTSNTGLTSAFEQIGAIAVGQTITVSFDVTQDNYNGNNYPEYAARLVLFNGASTRNSTTIFVNNTTAILAAAIGDATSNSSWNTIEFRSCTTINQSKCH